VAAAPQRTISGEVPNPDGYIPNLVAKQYGNTARLAHGVYSKRRFPLSDEEEAEVEGLLSLPHVVAPDRAAASTPTRRGRSWRRSLVSCCERTAP